MDDKNAQALPFGYRAVASLLCAPVDCNGSCQLRGIHADVWQALHKIVYMQGLANQPPWSRTALCGATLITLLLVCPVLNTLLGIPGFVPKILLTCAGSCATSAVATHIFSTLASAWFYQVQPFSAGLP